MPYQKRGKFFYRNGRKYTRKQIIAIHLSKARRKGKKK